MKPDIFQFDDQPVRVAMIDDEPWFVAADAGRILGIGNVRQSLVDFPDDEKGVTTTDTLGGGQAMTVLSEPGLYRLIFQSRKAEAERFKKWVFAEVLPAIRKTGSYSKEVSLTGDVAEVRGMVLTALRGLEAGTVPLGRARVTANLAAQYFRSWHLTLESSDVEVEVPRLASGPGTDEEWQALGVAAVQKAAGNDYWRQQAEYDGAGAVTSFVVTSEKLGRLADEQGLLGEIRKGRPETASRIGAGMASRLAGRTLAVAEMGTWSVAGWRNAMSRGWEFRREGEVAA